MKIAFGYKISSGKDTCVEYLIEKYGGIKVYFAKYLYDILYYAQKLCGFQIEKDRKFLQWIGTEWAREKDPDIWVKLTIQESKKIINEHFENKKEIPNLYCSDVRFINEFNELKKDGWVMIKILRSNNINDERIGNGKYEHISENQLDLMEDSNWDYVIENNGSKEELFEKLEKIIIEINK